MVIQLSWEDIESRLPRIDLLSEIERGFVAYSGGRANVPPVGELLFDKPPGEAHIKYGYIEGDAHFLVKVATGFYENAARGLRSSSGVVLLFDRVTGEPAAILLEEGRLTDLRTAVAGAIAAKYLAPQRISAIGMFGAGLQARLQLEQLHPVTSCRKVFIWARRKDAAAVFAGELRGAGYDATACATPARVAAEANLLITATAAPHPFLKAADVQPGTHITAVGADTPEKNELEPALFGRADVVVADSLAQCRARGELHHALEADISITSAPVELGAVIEGRAKGRTNDRQITIADLTGVAVQDIRIAEAVFQAFQEQTG